MLQRSVVCLLKLFLFLLCAVLLFVSLLCEASPDTKSDASPPAPWFSGPLLAPSGHTTPPGNLNFEPYLFYTDNLGIYTNVWQKAPRKINAATVNPTFIAYYGLSSHFDISTSIPYLFNYDDQNSANNIGDVGLTLSYQAMNEIPGTWHPDLKLMFQETFPTGDYRNLDPALEGADSTGAGSYQTALGLVIQKLWNFSGHFFRARLSITYTIPADTELRGVNAYGGATNTNGTINLGNEFTSILGLEYTLTQHWVPALDISFNNSARNIFSGFLGSSDGKLASISELPTDILSLAPAIEYNFNANMGIIAGVWFSVTGKSANQFVSGVIAFNYNMVV